MHPPRGFSINEKSSPKNNNGQEETENGCGRLTIASSASSSINQYQNIRVDQKSSSTIEAVQNNFIHQLDLAALQQTLTAAHPQLIPQRMPAALPQTSAHSNSHQQQSPQPGQRFNLMGNLGVAANNGGITLSAQFAQQLLLAKAAAAAAVPQALFPTAGCVPRVAAGSPYSYLLSAAAASNLPLPFYFLLNNNLSPSAGGSGGTDPSAANSTLPQNLILPQQQQTFCDPQAAMTVTADRRQPVDFRNCTTISNKNDYQNILLNSGPSSSSSMSARSTLASPANELCSSQRTTASTVLSAEEIEQRISKLISENEAIIEPSPMLTKRRPYARQHGSLDYSTMRSSSPRSSASTGRGIRSQSLVETSCPPGPLPSFHHTATTAACEGNNQMTVQKLDPVTVPSSMNALSFHAQVETATMQAMNKLYNCKFCRLGVRHLDELKRHEEKCARREELAAHREEVADGKMIPATLVPTQSPLPKLITTTAAPSPSFENNRFPLKKRILFAATASASGNAEVIKISTNNNITTSNLVSCHKEKEENEREVVKKEPVATSPPTFSLHNNNNNNIGRQRNFVQHDNSFTEKQPPPQQFVASDAYLGLIPKISLSSSEQLGILHPYCVTVKVPGAVCLETTGAGRKLHQVTHPTNSSSLRQISPCSYSLIDSKNSDYSSWSQIAVSPLESKLNIMLMDGCIMRSHRPYLNYTVAQKDLNQMRVIWTNSLKNNFRQLSSTTSLSSVLPICGTDAGQLTPVINMDEEIDVTPITPNEDSLLTLKEVSNTVPPANEEVVNKSILTSSSCGINNNNNNNNNNNSSATSSSSTSLSKELLKTILTANCNNNQSVKKVTVCNGGYKTNEAYTYVRGRGRGRYVCARCGIRCKKPSMLKKHIKSHLNVRPYSCSQCMFSFKTKGNLTKHLKSKSHSKKCASLQSRDERNCSTSMDQSCTAVDTAEEDSDETLSEDELETLSDDEEEVDTMAQHVWQHGTDPTNELRQRTFPFKNIWNRVRTGQYFERQVKTPPSDFLCSTDDNWDRCDSAPPSLTLETNCGAEFCTTISSTNLYNNNNNESNNTISKSSTEQNYFKQQQIQTFETSTKNNYINCLSEGKIQCEICGKEFVKIGLLKLHTAAHMFEQSSKRYDYKCNLCNSCFRSKNLLQKHLLHAHPQQNHLNSIAISSATSNFLNCNSSVMKSPTSSSTCQVNVSNNSNLNQQIVSPSSTNPRPFECHDCNVAFRIHGHLAKHLRSKSHIMKLECLEKVPIGTFAKLEESNGDYLADIDTSDSHNSLQSLLKLARRLMSNETIVAIHSDNNTNNFVDQQQLQCRQMSPKNGIVMNNKVSNTGSGVRKGSSDSIVSSLVCTEHLIPSPSPPPPPPLSVVNVAATKKVYDNKKISYDISNHQSSTTSKTVVADVWIPPKENCDKIIHSSMTTFKEPSLLNQEIDYNKEKNSNNNTNNNNETSNFDDTLHQPTNENEKLCKFCNALFCSTAELEIHWHADHVFMRDGRNFKCPKANCDTVYPSKRDLRNHLASHYYSTVDSDIGCGDVSKSTVAALSKKIGYCSAGVSPLLHSSVTVDSSADGIYSKKLQEKMKSHLVKLKFTKNDTATYQTSNDNSPISDSDASRASVISSRSVSPTAGETCTSSSRQHLKRHSLEDCSKSLTPSKRAAVTADEIQHYSGSTSCEPAAHTLTPAATPNSLYQNANPSPVAVPVPVIGQRPAAGQSIWTSFLNCGASSSPQPSLFLTANHNPVSLLGLQHPAIVAAAAAAAFQENAKVFNGVWPSNFMNPNPAAFQILASASPHLFAGLPSGAQMFSGSPSSSSAQENVFSIEHLRCNLCQKQCYSPLALQEHLIWHNQPRLHICKFCDAGFTTAQSLQAHMPCRLQKN